MGLIQRWGILGVVLAASAGSATAAGSSAGAMAWSPDGRWIAYVVEVPAGSPAPPETDWIFDVSHRRTPNAANNLHPFRSQLWATRVATRESVLIDEVDGTITPPGWSSDGRSLAYGRIQAAATGRTVLQIVRVDARGPRILLAEACDDSEIDQLKLLVSPAAWSGDGRFLVVPHVRPIGLAILRAENGRVVRTITAAAKPAWSPDSNRLFFITTGDEDRLECLEGEFRDAKQLAALGQVDSIPSVSRDGKSVIVVGRVRVEGGLLAAVERVELRQISVDGKRKELLHLLRDGEVGREISTTSAAVYQDADEAFTVVNLRGLPTQVTRLRYRSPQGGQILKLFPVLDFSLVANDLALNPAGTILALRIGEPGVRSLPVLIDVETTAPTLLAPGPAVSAAWVSLLLRTTESLLSDRRGPAVLDGRAIERRLALPFPGEIDASSDDSGRLRRLARHARTLLDPAVERPEVDRRLVEIHLFFASIQDDHRAALADLDRLDLLESTPRRRLDLLAIRGQSYAGAGDFDRARDVFRYLKTAESHRAGRRIETTSTGTTLHGADSAAVLWCDYGLNRIDVLAAELVKKKEPAFAASPFGNANPDAPLGFDGRLVPPVIELPRLNPPLDRQPR